tara:strand:+ start:961 stop:3330 length:2370 start_codon:yes stop_codon:yes gene_type:complete
MSFLTDVNSSINSFSIEKDNITQVFNKYNQYKGFDISKLKNMNNIKTKIINQEGFTTYTFSPEAPKNRSDDIVYHSNPELQILLPRALTLIFDNKNYKFITDLTGPRKFSGNDSRDDDDGSDVVLFDLKKAISWVNSNNCQVVRTTKANGKFVIMKLFKYKGKNYIIFGSKNVHNIILFDELNQFDSDSDIINSLANDIYHNSNSILKLTNEFDNGWSLVGELEDGMHFTPGDNTVAWIGLFKNGLSINNFETINYLQSIGLRTVSSEIVFNPGDSIENFNNVFNLAKCDTTEGNVLVIRNISNNDSMLCKSKSALYILKRCFREKWKNQPSTIFTSFPKRVIETSDYHGLNTQAAIKFTKQLFDFAIWLGITKSYPTGVLDHQPVVSVRGILPNGFTKYWEDFITQTNIEPVTFTPEDFGNFNQIEYLDSDELKFFKNIISQPPLVVFIQDIQGAGKSSIAEKLNAMKVEQDWCYGCTKVTQFQLMYHISNGNNVVISRCNAEPKQYQAYQKIAMSHGCKILFITSNDMKSPLRLGVALAGVINRSNSGDNIIVGRKEYPLSEVVEFTTSNWKKFKQEKNAIVVNSFKFDKNLENQAITALSKNKFVDFLNNNFNKLMNLRLPLDSIVLEYQKLIDKPPNEFLYDRKINEIIYTSINIVDNTELISAVKSIDKDWKTKDLIVCHHITQIFYGKKGKSSIKPIPEGLEYKIEIDALVIDKKTGSSAFRVNKILDNQNMEVEVETKKPHITAILSKGSKPSDSLSFVFKDDDSVEIHLIKINTIGLSFWN